LSEFIDHLKFTAAAGDGGRGCVSFRREKFVPRGGPNGGDGGRGGHVTLKATAQRTTLSHLRANSLVRAGRGGHGKGSNRTGADGKDKMLGVPLGTVVRDAATALVLGDLVGEGQELVVAQGGRGGLGNASFAGPTNQAPRYAQPGEPGVERLVELELKLLAEVGIVGLPNAGKSTLTARVTAARPKIASYPFTTLVPVLGVVDWKDRSFVVAEIPGLIEGSHAGAGLGHRFLRHAERTRTLLHLIDVGGPESADPVRSLEQLDEELRLFQPLLAEKPQLVVGNKIDLNPPEGRIDSLRRVAAELGRPFCAVSAATGEGLDGMFAELVRLMDGSSVGGEGGGDSHDGR